MTPPETTLRPDRVERSLLSVPATSERFFAKAAASAADTVMLDLEDSVAPGQKVEARRQVIPVVNGRDWGRRTLAVRVNALDTPWGVRDLLEVAEACPRLDLVMVPKVERAEDLFAVETILLAAEQAAGRSRPIGIAAQMESALGLTNIEAIAAATPRLESVSFGPGDYAASIGNRARVIGGPDPDYAVLTDPDGGGRRERHWNDAWHYAMARTAVACKAHGVRVLDGPYVNIPDSEGFLAAARRAASLGFNGKWAIHPSQIDLANRVFGPTAEEVAWAEALLAEMAKAHAEGAGAIKREGQMVDMAHVRQARRIKVHAEQIAARGREGGE